MTVASAPDANRSDAGDVGVDLDRERLAAARAVLDRPSRGRPGRHRRHRPDRAEEREQRRDVVRADVEDRAGARSVQERGARVVPLVPGTHEERARADDVAEPAVVDEAAARLQPPAHERVGRAAHPQARGVGDGQELAALRERRGEGLLRVDVLARLQRGEVERRVGIRGREVEHDVDLVVREQLVGRRVRLRQPVLRRLAASLVEVAAGAADHADDVAVAREVGEVDVADVADPDDPDAERVHVLRAPLPGAPGGAPGASVVAATAIRIAWSASRAVHGLGISRRATRRNARSSALYAASNRVEERGPGGTCQRRGLRLQRADRRPPVEADRHRIPRADDLHPDVVAEGVVAGLPEDRERAVGEGEDGRARVDVAVLREHRETLAPRPPRRPR